MARLVGLIANRPDLCTRFAEQERAVLTARNPSPEPWGWGIGFFQSGEILLKRRPIDDRAEIATHELIAEVSANLLLAHVRRATVGALRTDNTQPFRYQQWMFAATGTVSGFASVREKLLASLPDFLQRSFRGDTDTELLFYLALSFLHDQNLLDHPSVGARDVGSALQASVGLLNRLTRDAGLAPSPINLLFAAPDFVVAARHGTPMAYRVLRGREDFAPLFGQEGLGRMREPDLESCRLSAVASDFEGDEVPPDWTAMEPGAMLAFSRTDDPQQLTG